MGKGLLVLYGWTRRRKAEESYTYRWEMRVLSVVSVAPRTALRLSGRLKRPHRVMSLAPRRSVLAPSERRTNIICSTIRTDITFYSMHAILCQFPALLKTPINRLCGLHRLRDKKPRGG